MLARAYSVQVNGRRQMSGSQLMPACIDNKRHASAAQYINSGQLTYCSLEHSRSAVKKPCPSSAKSVERTVSKKYTTPKATISLNRHCLDSCLCVCTSLPRGAQIASSPRIQAIASLISAAISTMNA
eukprot:15104-Heterococcus_DN1.PRE.1